MTTRSGAWSILMDHPNKPLGNDGFMPYAHCDKGNNHD